MADISMCDGAQCPIKQECYRYTAPKNEYRQAFFTYVPYDHARIGCEYFIDNSEYLKYEAK
jgi:hypothetical protein